MPTLWEVPDDLWERIEPLINELDPPKTTGRPRQDPRRILDALMFRFRTGCRWNQLPRIYGDDATVHRTFQRWQRHGLFAKIIWPLLIDEGEAGSISDCQWQAADAALGEVRWGGDALGADATDGANKATKRSLPTESRGGSLAVVVALPARGDTELPAPTLAGGDVAIRRHSYGGHIGRTGEVPPTARRPPRHPASGRLVERTHAWLAQCRAILVRRFEIVSKRRTDHLVYLCLSESRLAWRRCCEKAPHFLYLIYARIDGGIEFRRRIA